MLRTGTLVTHYAYDPENDTVGERNCNGYNSGVYPTLDICVGIIVEQREEDSKVHWVQFCSYHINETMPMQWLENPCMWEIGQIN